MTQVNRGKPILALVDLNHPDGASCLARAAAAESEEAELHLAFVLPYGPYGSYVGALISDETVDEIARRAHEGIEALADGLASKRAPSLHVLRGGVGEQALKLARQIDAGLIMLNARREGPEAHHLGPHAAQIMRYADCSVLVMRE